MYVCMPCARDTGWLSMTADHRRWRFAFAFAPRCGNLLKHPTLPERASRVRPGISLARHCYQVVMFLAHYHAPGKEEGGGGICCCSTALAAAAGGCIFSTVSVNSFPED